MATTDQINTRKIRELSDKVDARYKEFTTAMTQALGSRVLEGDEYEDEKESVGEPERSGESFERHIMCLEADLKGLEEILGCKNEEIASLEKRNCALLKRLDAKIKNHPDTLKKIELIGVVSNMADAFHAIIENAIEFTSFTKKELESMAVSEGE